MTEALRPQSTAPLCLQRLARHPSVLLGALLVLAVVSGAVFAPLLSPYDPVALNSQDRLQGPSVAHPLGTDQYGRDNLSRILYGGRTSLLVAGSSILFALVVGGTLGLLAGYLRGGVNMLIMRVTDVPLSFPAIRSCSPSRF
jgi:peptide/nickel transport system permease protein